MRLISQDGEIDVPYERVVIKATEHRFDTVITALFEREDYMKDIVMGYYSTKAKALKVMEMLREKNFWDKDVFKFPADEEVEAQDE